MKTFAALALLTTIFASSVSFAGEIVVVTAPRIPGGGGTGGVGFPRPGTGTVHCEQRDCGKGVDDTGAGLVPKTKLGGWEIGDAVKTDLVEGVLTKILSRSISAEMTVYVEIKDKEGNEYKIWVNIKGSSSTTK